MDNISGLSARDLFPSKRSLGSLVWINTELEKPQVWFSFSCICTLYLIVYVTQSFSTFKTP